MNDMAHLLNVYGLTLAVGAALLLLLILITLFSKTRSQLCGVDYCSLVLPFLTWLVGFKLQQSKSLTNPIIEPVVLLALIVVMFGARAAVGKKRRNMGLSITILIILALAGFLVGASLHALPE